MKNVLKKLCAVSGLRAFAGFRLSLVDIRVVILSSGEPGSLRSPTTSLIDQVVRENGWAASLPSHMSYNPTCLNHHPHHRALTQNLL